MTDSGVTSITLIPLVVAEDETFYNVPGGCGTCGAGTLNQMDYIEITLTSRFDVDTAADSLENPEYALTTRVNPIGHSRND